MGSLLVAAVVVIFAMIMISRIARVVPQQNAWVVERLGKYDRTLQAGFHIRERDSRLILATRDDGEILQILEQTLIFRER